MESAPTIPKDKAILPEITFVITYVTIGRIIIVEVWALVIIHAWPNDWSKKRKKKPPKISKDISVNFTKLELIIFRVDSIILDF